MLHVAHHQKVVTSQPFRNIIILNSLFITIISKENIIGIKSSLFFSPIFGSHYFTLLFFFFFGYYLLKKEIPYCLSS